MPRPKRYKVAPSIPAKVQQRVSTSALKPPTAKEQQTVQSSEPSEPSTNGSDDSDGLVVKKRTGITTSDSMAHLYTMSGALPAENVGATRLRPPSGQTRAALSRIVREADYAKAKEERAKRVEAQTDYEQIPSSIPPEMTLMEKPSASGLGVSFTRQRSQDTQSKIVGTPQLYKSSTLGGITFKKRPRQPSLLQMVQARNNGSESSDEDGLYDFLPDDESTPLIKSLSQNNAQSKSSSSQQTSSSRKRKLATPEIQVPTSQPLETLSSPSVVSSQSLERGDLVHEANQPEPTLPQLRTTQIPQPQIYDDTLAPPQSSSPRPQPKAKAVRGKSSKDSSKAKTAPQSRRIHDSPNNSLLSSTSTQVSPARPAKLKPLSTAHLQNLLPRRRARPRPKGNYDIPSSSDVELDNTALGEDEDELSFHATSKMRRKKSAIPILKSAAKAKHQGSEPVVGGKAKRISKTYTRKTTIESDDENDSDDDIISDKDNGPIVREKSKAPAMDGKAKAEMERLAAKFREVDEFTLDFEDMTGSSSQMKDAR